MSSLIDLTLHEAGALLAGGTVSSQEICRAFLRRAEKMDSSIGAFLYLDPEAVMKAAESADARRASGNVLSPLDGIPIAVKDNLSVTGQPCTCGSRILKGYTAPFDATVIRKLKDAGMFIFGRTNLDEFAMGSSTENSSFLTTSNPWNPERVPGGSSGGSAAAVASRQITAALGSDTGGSIRQPASFCGVVGLKPTYGSVSRYGLVAYASSLDQIGPITRDVRDAALLFDVIKGQDPRDSTSLPDDPVSCAERLVQGDMSSVTVGMPKEYFEVEGLSADVRDAVLHAAARFRDMGANVIEVSLPHTDYAIAAYYIIATAEASANLARFDGIRYGYRDADGEAEDLLETYTQSRAKGFGQEVKRRIILGTYVLSSGYYDAYYLKAQKVRTLIRNDFTEAFAHADIILAPTAPTPAFKKGAMSTPLEMYLSDIYTISVNLAGIPGISVPCGLSSEGLPVGVQLLARAGNETGMLQAAFALEQARGPFALPELAEAAV